MPLSLALRGAGNPFPRRIVCTRPDRIARLISCVEAWVARSRSVEVAGFAASAFAPLRSAKGRMVLAAPGESGNLNVGPVIMVRTRFSRWTTACEDDSRDVQNHQCEGRTYERLVNRPDQRGRRLSTEHAVGKIRLSDQGEQRPLALRNR
jgi:hypothetical protein